MYKNTIETDELKSDDFKKLKKENEELYPASFNSDAVKGVQSFLNEEGYTDKKGEKLYVDGRYGAKTANAVMDYQRENGLSVDGIVGDETWESIYRKKKKKEERIDKSSSENWWEKNDGNIPDVWNTPKIENLPHITGSEQKNRGKKASEKSEEPWSRYLPEKQIKPWSPYVPGTEWESWGIYKPDEVKNPAKTNVERSENELNKLVSNNIGLYGYALSETEKSGESQEEIKSKTEGEENNWLIKFIQESARIDEEAEKIKGETINALQKEAQREIWKTGAKEILEDWFKCPISAYMLEHSLQDNPTTMMMGNESDIAKLIVKDPVYLNALDKAIANSDGETIDTDLEGIAFDTPDLYYSIHKATIHVKGYKNKEGKWIITAMLEDTYDFTEWMTLSKDEDGKWKLDIRTGTVANDVAKISQMSGAINPYKVRVYFNTVR